MTVFAEQGSTFVISRIDRLQSVISKILQISYSIFFLFTLDGRTVKSRITGYKFSVYTRLFSQQFFCLLSKLCFRKLVII